MTRRIALIAVLLTVSVVAIAVVSGFSRTVNASAGLVVHEWGTFTSIAGEQGHAVQWLPQAGPSDLPCFVERVNAGVKGSLSGTVRMETPVIYFYAPSRMTVNVRVRFRQGVITEWFPRPGGKAISPLTAAAALRGEIAWSDVQVLSSGPSQFPIERDSNHYYVARQTDAAALQVGAEQERFLFYRGVGRLAPPIAAIVSPEGQIIVSHTRGSALGDIILFENRDGAVAYQARHTSADRVAFNPLEPEGEGLSPAAHLVKTLVAHGLYPKEAKAMVESWRGSWFEQGTRLFYILSNDAVDAILPLQVEPAPAEVKRVFVGRLEIATAATLNEIRIALQNNDAARLAQYGRFLEPLGRRVTSALPAADRHGMERRMQTTYTPWISDVGLCGKAAN